MRKFKLAILGILVLNSGYSQYINTLNDNCTWYKYYYFEVSGTEKHIILGDSIINDTIYKKLVWVSKDSLLSAIDISYLREDTITKQIFIRDYYGKENILYNYGMSVADTFWLPNKFWDRDNYFILDSITSNLNAQLQTLGNMVNIPFKNRRVFYLSKGNEELIWIEGIGSLYGLHYKWDYRDYNLICHFDSSGYRDLHLNIDSTCNGPIQGYVGNNKTEELLIYPNPTNGLINIKKDRIDKIQIVSCLGQVVLEANGKNRIDLKRLENGIYVIIAYYDNLISINKVIKQ